MQSMKYKMRNGFVLIYTVIVVGVILVAIGVGVSSALTEMSISRNEEESLKAFYAADTGIECARFWQENFQVFDPTTPKGTYDCGVGSFTAGFDPPAEDCIDHVYSFTLDGFSNGSCAEVRATVVPRTIIISGNPVIVCDLQVISNGRNSCSAGGVDLVERTRWEDM